MPHTDVLGLTTVNGPTEQENRGECRDLIAVYDQLSGSRRIGWSTSLRLQRQIGAGGQGTVYLAERVGSDGFGLPVAIKFFSPERYRTAGEYDRDMARVGSVASQVARIQHENLLKIGHFLTRDRIRMMVMEFVDGYDLRSLLTPRMYGRVKDRFSQRRWQRFNESVVTAGSLQPRLQEGAAAVVIRDCLSGLSALHREGLTHGDIKPSNIMLNRHGLAKIIDLGSAARQGEQAVRHACTPTYAAPEVLKGDQPNEASDMASLGYTALEMLSGQKLFDEHSSLALMQQAKQRLPQILFQMLPEGGSTGQIADLLTQMIEVQPDNRIDGEQAILALDEWIATTAAPSAGSREQLVNDLDSPRDGIRIWIEELLEIRA